MQAQALRDGVEGGVLDNPGVFVKERDGVKAGGRGGIDVALDAGADHPAYRRRR